MKKLFIAAFAFFAVVGVVSAETWNCNLRVDLSGTHVGLVLHHTELNGVGHLTCTNTQDGTVEKRAVSSRVSNWSAGLVSYAKYDGTQLRAHNVSVDNVNDFFDEFDLFVFWRDHFYQPHGENEYRR